ncbi:MAG: hypothetical protein M1533_02730 [Candidatus Thermoplasmatota archaeon]|jgi:DNA-directed RNA polymerase subunit F|nr:hypothetical protein [Candidatus Thermoplasmatota archaeon]MCL5793355.1 hypothetical protein [Candidatus Thermoplasmatota archaeon]
MTKKEYISIPEVFKILSEKKDLSESEAENLGYVERFLKIKGDVSRMKKELQEKFSLPEEVAVKLLDLVPKTKEEVTPILSTYKILLGEKDLNNLLDYLQELAE